jgi:hypothetical protein
MNSHQLQSERKIIVALRLNAYGQALACPYAPFDFLVENISAKVSFCFLGSFQPGYRRAVRNLFSISFLKGIFLRAFRESKKYRIIIGKKCPIVLELF